MLVRGDGMLDIVRRRRNVVALVLLLLTSFALRVYQYDWDLGHLYHPDERFILMSTAAISLSWPLNLAELFTTHSTLIPQDFSYSYGTFSFYILRLVAAILVGINHLLPFLTFLDPLNDLGNLRLVGRPMSALFDTASVYLIYRIGVRLYGRRVGFLAAGFVAFSVIDIQLSHFYATDTILTCLVLATIAASVSFVQSGRRSHAIWAGVFAGFALATKASAAPILVPVFVAQLLRLFGDSGSGGFRPRRPDADGISRAAVFAAVTLAATAVAFIVAEPFAIIDFKRFTAGILEQGNMVRGVADLPYTRQYFERPAYLYFLQNLILFGAGIPLGLAMLAGSLYVVVRNARMPRGGDLILLSYVIPYFLLTGEFWAKFLRYMLPISPLLGLFGAVFLIRLFDVARHWRITLDPGWIGSPDLPRETVRLPPEFQVESTSTEFELADLAFFDGNGKVHGAPDEAFEVAESTRLPEFANPSIASVETVAVVEVQPRTIVLDREGERWFAMKGLSVDLFEIEDPVRDDVAAAPRTAASNGVAVDTSSDGWTEIDDPWNAPAFDDRFHPWSVPAFARRSTRAMSFLRGSWPTRLVVAAIALVLAFSAFYSLAYDHMYVSVTPPVAGSEWLYANAPKGSVLATEHWEEGMPVPLPTDHGIDSAESYNFRNVTMPMYEDDTPAKLNTIVQNLAAADYIVFFSNRLYGTVPRIPGRYPMSQRYYEQLFGEQLGFTLVEADARYPNLLGVAFVDDTLADPGLPTPALLQSTRPAPITINLGHADESFTVYDHQKVLIFKKTQRLSQDQLRALIGPAPAASEITPTGATPRYRSLLLSPIQARIVSTQGTFSDLFNRNDILNQVPLLVWILMIALIGLAAAPIGFLVFRFLPDRGYLVSKTLGVLLVAWLSWIVVSIGIVTATGLEAIGALVAIVAIGGAAAYRQRDEIEGFLRANRRLVLFEEGLFWVAFLYDVWVRSLNPDLWHPSLGGEKPMDLAYLTAAIRSPVYPPYDPWYAGGYLNYYYFGQIIVGTLTKISGVVPTTAYNLIVPLLFALTVGGAFTVAISLIRRGNAPPNRGEIAGGVLASLMVCVLGNVGGFIQFAGDISQLSTSQIQSALPGVAPTANFLTGLYATTLGGRPLNIPPDWFWSSTRMLALLNIQGGTGSINEFPYFTFLFADLHAHLIGLPLTLLALAGCVSLLKSRSAHIEDVLSGIAATWQSGLTAREALASTARMIVPTVTTLFVMGLAVGALYPTNSWDYPTYVGLVALALLVPWYASPNRGGRALLIRLGVLAIVVALSQLLFLPFSVYFQSFYSGVHLSDEKSEIRWYFVINGLFLVIMVSYFLLEGWAAYRRSGTLRSIRMFVTNWELTPRIVRLRRVFVRSRVDDRALIRYAILGVALLALLTMVGGTQLIAVLLVFLAAALVLGLRRDRSIEDCFMILLFATGLAISVGTELIVIDGDVGRMNTIFKFYEQIWVLFGIAGAVAIMRVRDRLTALRTPWVRRTWATVLVAFFLMAAIYPVIGTKARVSQRFDVTIPPTLDGTAYMDHAVYGDTDETSHLSAQLHFVTDKAAIQWLQDNVQGTPTILEGTRPLYRWGSRISIYTGLPTVIGWDWHQKQQRWGFQSTIDDRLNDVHRMYDDQSTEVTLSLLQKYGVRYIIDGELEQAFYPGARAKFDTMVGSTLSVAYDQAGVRIYQVK